MEQKQAGILQKRIREICKVFTILSFLIFFSCNSQEKKFIGGKFDVAAYSDKSYSSNGFKVIESKELKNFFHEKTPIFIEKGWQSPENVNISIVEFVAGHGKSFTQLDRNKNRYLFISLDGILKDTLKIPKGMDYAVCQLSKDKKESGIAVGKYIINGGNEYFEIHNLYGLKSNGNISKLAKNTTIFDCPAPADYIKEEEPDSYHFGMIGGKKLTRYWYENAEK